MPRQHPSKQFLIFSLLLVARLVNATWVNRTDVALCVDAGSRILGPANQYPGVKAVDVTPAGAVGHPVVFGYNRTYLETQIDALLERRANVRRAAIERFGGSFFPDIMAAQSLAASSGHVMGPDATAALNKAQVLIQRKFEILEHARAQLADYTQGNCGEYSHVSIAYYIADAIAQGHTRNARSLQIWKLTTEGLTGHEFVVLNAQQDVGEWQGPQAVADVMNAVDNQPDAFICDTYNNNTVGPYNTVRENAYYGRGATTPWEHLKIVDVPVLIEHLIKGMPTQVLNTLRKYNADINREICALVSGAQVHAGHAPLRCNKV